MDGDLVCNFKKCRRHLNGFAWVTSCSHIFCDDDGSREFTKALTCPACETRLPGKFDIIRTGLQPTEEYKSMVLAGQKPEVIMEISTRALSFWTYQTTQEKIYQEYVSTKAKERNAQLEQYYEQIVNRTQTELNTLKTQLSATKKELEGLKKKFSEASEKIMDKNRQYQKLQSLYDALRHKSIKPSSFEEITHSVSSPRNHNTFDLPIATGEELLRRSLSLDHSSGHATRRSLSPAEREFVFKPCSTPVMGTNASSSRAAVQHRFNIELGTPNGSKHASDDSRSGTAHR